MSENPTTQPQHGPHGEGCDCPTMPEDHSTVTLHMVMQTPDGAHPMELTVRFPKDMGLAAARALGTKMNDVIGPAFMDELDRIGDAQMAGFMRAVGPSLN